MPSDSLQAALVSLVCDTSSEELPEAAIDAAQVALADSIAIGIAGGNSPFRDPLLAVVRPWGSGGNGRVFASKERLPPASAAFMNAFQMHCLEYDAVHEAAVAHVATSPIAALLAEIDSTDEPVSGASLLTALVVGIEVASSLGVAADAPLRFFRPSTTGVFGAAAAIASLRGFNARMTRQAFGYALAGAAGTMQAHEEGMPTLPMQMAAAARAGLIAADLAATGIPTVDRAIEGRFGYLSMFESKVATDGLVERLAKPWRVTELSLKPFPSGRATHGGIEAMLRLRSQGLSGDNLASAELLAPPLIHHLVDRPAQSGMNVNYARLCWPYVAAVALKDGRVTIGDFTPDRLARSDTRAIADKIKVRINDVSDPSCFTPQQLTAIRHDGKHMQVRIEHLLGSPKQPMSAEGRRQKIIECLASAGLDATPADGLMALSDHLWQCKDCRDLLDSFENP